jgi:hypothetical protein
MYVHVCKCSNNNTCKHLYFTHSQTLEVNNCIYTFSLKEYDAFHILANVVWVKGHTSRPTFLCSIGMNFEEGDKELAFLGKG